MDNLEELGKYIRGLRKDKKLTIKEISDATGISRPYLSQVENGKGGLPSLNNLFKIADALDIPRHVLTIKSGYSATNDYANSPLPFNPSNITKDHLESPEQEDGFFQMFLRNRDIVNYLKGMPEITFHGQFLNTEERERVIKMLELLFADKINPRIPE